MEHLHLLADASFKQVPNYADMPFVEDWCLRLVKAINMELFLPPIVKYCWDEGNEGVSFICMITTSHISGHFFPNNTGKFDIYSCKRFEPDTFLELLKEFNPSQVHYTLIDRTEGIHKILA